MTSQALFEVPTGATAQAYIIDTTVRAAELPVNLVLTPDVKGFEKLPPLASWSFLVQSSKGQKVLFDLSISPDIKSYTPLVSDFFKDVGIKLEGVKHVSDTLKENGVDPAEIGSIIWSHHHWDHIGDITTFPSATELVVGPGFKEMYFPGYPAQQDSPLHQSQLNGRNIREIDFTEQNPTLKVGAFQAYDFFGDGSFYLLNTPGHTVGHIAGLVRTTTNPDTFIFMGGDLCHHGGEIRPSTHLPIPDEVHYTMPEAIRSRVPVCPGGAVFRELNIKRGRKPDEPFFDPVSAHDMEQALKTIKDAQVADAQCDVFFIYAHDMAIPETVDFFPKSANDWKEKGWREMTQWSFLAELTLGAVSPE